MSDRQDVFLRLPRPLVKRLDAARKASGLSRTKLVEMMLVRDLDELERPETYRDAVNSLAFGPERKPGKGTL